MKKYILIATMLFVSGNIKAQIDEIVGDWVEVRHARLDTLDTGFDLINKDWKAYSSGYKTLDSYYLVLSDIYHENEEYKIKLTITKEQDFFWVTNGYWLNEKMTYNTELNSYIIALPGYQYRGNMELFVRYDKENEIVQFVDSNSELTNVVYEFARK